MAIRYFNIKEKPDVGGSAIKVNPLNRTIEDISSNYFFKKIIEDKDYSHFKLIEGDYTILRDKTADAKTIDANPVILSKGRGTIAKICMDNSGNIRLYEKKKKLLINEISKSKAYEIKGETMRWEMMQSWV